jgi:hypothetical protein
MKNNIENIDKIIKEALTQEEAKFYDELDEQNLFQMIGGLFQGKMKWIMLMMNIIMVIFFGLFIYCVIQFLETENTNELIRWTVAGFICIMIVTFLKLFAWMQIDKNGLMREIKRLELQISSLANKMSA